MHKKYLIDLIQDKFKEWAGKKVIIVAPTGIGKTTFVLRAILPYLREKGKKLLIICNRKLLRQQYLFALVQEYESYEDLRASVDIKTYQEIAAEVHDGQSAEMLFEGYAVVVCDEAHYFYSDSDFNGFGTYGLLQIIVRAGMGKEMIFMTATADEVKPLLKETIQNCFTKHRLKTGEWKKYEGCSEIIELDYSMYADYDRFSCVAVPDEESLCNILVASPGKTIIFIDSKSKGEEMLKKFADTGKVSQNQMAILNADNIGEAINSEVVRNLTIAHKVVPKILITTSVLDNGVSIHDSDVENVVLITESRISFLQMLGRIRSEEGRQCKLYFLMRKAGVFFNRMNQYKQDCDNFEKLDKRNLNANQQHYIQAVWDGEEGLSEFYRKALVWMRHDDFCFILPKNKIALIRGDYELHINEFARRKCGNMYLAECKFYSLAVSDPLGVIYKQMEWIGKEPSELLVEKSRYLEMQWQHMKEQLLMVQGFDNKKLQEFKRNLVKEFRKELFPDIPSKNGVISTEKLDEICRRIGLKLLMESDSERRKKYSIVKAEKEEKEYDSR